jgi:hypothetical protein
LKKRRFYNLTKSGVFPRIQEGKHFAAGPEVLIPTLILALVKSVGTALAVGEETALTTI